MKIFIVHKGEDRDRIVELKKKIEELVDVDLLLMETDANKKTCENDKKTKKKRVPKKCFNKNKDDNTWFKEAKQKIKQSDMILYALGENTYSSPNVDKEIEYSLKKKKQIVLIRLNPEKKDVINKSLFKKDTYNNTDKPLFKEIKLDDLERILKQGYHFDVSDKLADTRDPKRESDLIEQYKAYLATSEDVLTRRQNTSNFYTTLNTSILTFATTISGVILGLPVVKNSMLVVSIITFVVSLIGILLNWNWFSLLESYGRLNGAKMRVISEMEKNLPANVYNTEWKVMSEKLYGGRYVSFTSIEKRIPIFFAIIFAITFCASIVAFVISLI